MSFSLHGSTRVATRVELADTQMRAQEQEVEGRGWGAQRGGVQRKGVLGNAAELRCIQCHELSAQDGEVGKYVRFTTILENSP